MPKFEKGVSGNPNGRGHAPSKISAKVKATLAELMDGELEKVVAEVKKLSGVQYLDYMITLLPYIASKKPSENNINVSQSANIDTTQLKDISLDAQRRIRDIMIAEQSGNRISDAVMVEELPIDNDRPF